MSTLNAAKNIGIEHNVLFRVIDVNTGKVVQQHEGHNSATNSLLTGIAHYLKGDGVLNQGYEMLNMFVPKYISLGTMGLINQESDDAGLPAGIGSVSFDGKTYDELSKDDWAILGVSDVLGNLVSAYSGQLVTPEHQEILRFVDYMKQSPGFGADGYDPMSNNNRKYDGIGLPHTTIDDNNQIVYNRLNCELISPSFPRTSITFRDVIPETEAELPQTIDVVFSAMISTGALAQFREPGKEYIYITEAGLWSRSNWVDGGDNGLLAGYRIMPPNKSNWDMADESNRDILKNQIIRVGINQVVQVIWKIQLGSVQQFISNE